MMICAFRDRTVCRQARVALYVIQSSCVSKYAIFDVFDAIFDVFDAIFDAIRVFDVFDAIRVTTSAHAALTPRSGSSAAFPPFKRARF